MTLLSPEATSIQPGHEPIAPAVTPVGVLAPVRIVLCGEDQQIVRIEDIAPASDGFIEEVVRVTDALAREQGGGMPLPALREVITNLVHAHFAAASIIIMDAGRRIVVADRGPGIADAHRALLPGYSTATAVHRRYMRGTGMGLPLAKAALAAVGGRMSIDANLSHGSIVSLDLTPAPPSDAAASGGRPRLSDREKRVLSLLGDLGTAGPSIIANDLRIPLSTAHRLLTRLEQAALVLRDAKGKRRLSEKGIQQIGLIFSQ